MYVHLWSLNLWLSHALFFNKLMYMYIYMAAVTIHWLYTHGIYTCKQTVLLFALSFVCTSHQSFPWGTTQFAEGPEAKLLLGDFDGEALVEGNKGSQPCLAMPSRSTHADEECIASQKTNRRG